MTSRKAVARLWAIVVALASAAALSACEDDTGHDSVQHPTPLVEPTVDIEHAQQVYHPLLVEVVEAVAEVSVPGRPDDLPEVIFYDRDRENCFFGSLHYNFDTVFGEDVSWDDVRAASAKVLEPEGFKLSEMLDIPGGHNGYEATTDNGTTVIVRSKLGNPSTLTLTAAAARVVWDVTRRPGVERQDQRGRWPESPRRGVERQDPVRNVRLRSARRSEPC